MSDALAPRMFKIESTINAGHLLQAAVLTVGFITWLAAGSHKVDLASRGVDDLRQQVQASAVYTREEIKAGLSRVEGAVIGLQGQVANLPDLTARVRHLEEAGKRLEERVSATDERAEGRRLYVDARIEKLREEAVTLRAELEGLRRAYVSQLPRR